MSGLFGEREACRRPGGGGSVADGAPSIQDVPPGGLLRRAIIRGLKHCTAVPCLLTCLIHRTSARSSTCPQTLVRSSGVPKPAQALASLSLVCGLCTPLSDVVWCSLAPCVVAAANDTPPLPSCPRVLPGPWGSVCAEHFK